MYTWRVPVLCPRCGSSLPDDARFCPQDGTTIDAPPDGARSIGSDGDPLIGRVIDGRYRISARLGAGGVGTVYEGEHIEIKKRVAVKVLHGAFAVSEEFRRRFEREARAASRLDHPSCVTVIDFGRIAQLQPMEGAVGLLGAPYLVMELVRGTVLVDHTAVGAVEAVRIVLGILAALRHAHSLGIIHRDVKPANVMLLADDDGGRPRVKLLDFGLAKDLGGADGPEEPITQAGTVFGTPSYLSPELASGAKADGRSDLYSTGVVLFELVCGRRPFVHDNPLDIVRDHLSTPPPAPRSLASISVELEQVILRALAKDPAARFADAGEFAAALGATVESKGPALSSPPKKIWPARLSPAVAALTAGGVVVIVILIAVAAHHRRPAPLPPPVAPPPISATSKDALWHLSLAANYQRRLWCSNALEELERALKSDVSARSEPQLAQVAIACLTPKTRDKAIAFLVENLGNDALAPLKQAVASDPNAEIRKGAERAIAQLTSNRAPSE